MADCKHFIVDLRKNQSYAENEPIVNEPINCFLRTSMDMLVMENILVETRG